MPPTKRIARRVVPPTAPVDDVDDDDTEPEPEPVRTRTSNGNQESFDQGRSEATPDPDDDDDAPSPRPVKKASAKAAGNGDAPPIRPGWTEGQKQMESTATFAQALKPEEKSMVIKFLEDQPYANFRRHWVDRTTPQGKTRRAYTCPRTFDKECPLCEVGDRPQAVAAFNVAVIGDDGQVLLKSWDTGARLFQTLKGYAGDPKIAPLTKGFYLVNKTGKKGSQNTNVIPIKATALEEDYDIPVPEQAELDRLKKYDPSIVELIPMRELREIAAELDEDYDNPDDD